MAASQFRRQILYLVVAGIISVPAALAYLASNGPITISLALAVTFGVFVSIVLGGGLMAAGFYSSGSGLDDAVAGAGVEPPGVATVIAAAGDDVRNTVPPAQLVEERSRQ